ncbi:MAG: hypothetical protein ACLR7Z_16200 [Bilophila wadsworthia]
MRELEFVIERSLLLSRSKAVGTPLKFEFAPEVEGGAASPEDGWPSLAELEQRYIRRVLEKTGNKLMGPGSATELLGVHYTTLRAHMLKMGPRRAGRAVEQGSAQFPDCVVGESFPFRGSLRGRGATLRRSPVSQKNDSPNSHRKEEETFR